MVPTDTILWFLSFVDREVEFCVPAPAAFPAGVDPNRGSEETVRSPGETVRSPGVL